jgi:hypothetical protein
MLLNNVLTVALMAAAAFGASPIVCNLKALSPAERTHHAALSEKLRTAALDRRELPDGLAFRLSAASMTLTELADWVDAERRCCPFLEFRITLERESGALQLALTGRDGVKEFLLADFAKAGAATR